MSLQIKTIVSMPFAENSYILWREGQTEAIVVDPGLEPNLILEELEELGLKLVAIFNTHGHSDHIAGNAAMKQAFPNAPLIIGVNDAPLLTDPVLNLSRQFGFDLLSPPADQLVREGDNLLFVGTTFDILDIPGHSPGHVVFVIRDEGKVIGGDVLFQEGIGRTDFPGGSHRLLLEGIRNKLFPMPDETIVYPGHGPTTTIGHEKEYNPFLT
jgi:hydroxyacylglutathione hydrolase